MADMEDEKFEPAILLGIHKSLLAKPATEQAPGGPSLRRQLKVCFGYSINDPGLWLRLMHERSCASPKLHGSCTTCVAHPREA